jgi:phosphatidylglycerophosphate synthase
MQQKLNFLFTLVSEYQKSLKPAEIEEPVNLFINRPLGFLIAKFFQMLRVGPNSVTMLSLLCGVSAGVLLARTFTHDMLTAAILLQCAIVFDCADGQLARLKGGGSRFGRVIDTYADLTIHGFLFAGTAIGLFRTGGAPLYFLLAFLSLVSMHYHMALFDHFKSVYINVVKPEQADRLVCLKNITDKLQRMEGKRSPLVTMITKMYVGFYKLESRVVTLGYPPFSSNFYLLFPDPGRIDSNTRELYKREMRLPTRLWTMIGDTIHLEIFVLCACLNRPGLIFPLLLICTNLLMIVALVVQRTRYVSLGLGQEAIFQERYD